MIGSLRHRVSLERKTVARDAALQGREQWSTVGYRWAEIRPLSGRELFQAQQFQAEVTHEVTLRYLDLDSTWRINHDGRTFEIMSVVNDDERNHLLRLLCKED